MAVPDCSNKGQVLAELFKDILTVDDVGNPAIRVVLGVDSGDPFITCTNKTLTDEEIAKSVIIADCNGKPALNLAAFPCV